MISFEAPIDKKALAIYELLKDGKKVTTIGENKLKYCMDWNNPNEDCYSSDKTEFYDIVYFRANPQMNRIIGLLSNGKEVDIKLGLFEIMWNSFTEYIHDECPTSWKDIFNGNKLFLANYRQVIEKAKESGYKYVSFNGSIYAIRDQDMLFPLGKSENI